MRPTNLPIRLSLLAVVALLAIAVPAGTAQARVHGCNPHRQLKLAAAKPSAAAGRRQLAQVAKLLRGGPSICGAAPSRWLRSRLRSIHRGPGAHRAVLAALRTIASHSSVGTPRALARIADATPCDLDRTRHIDVRSATQTVNDLALAARAAAAGDDAGAQAAFEAAAAAFRSWAQPLIASSQSVPDLTAIAQAALMLGDDDVANAAMARALSLAETHYQQLRAQMDTCSPTQHDLDCQTRAAAEILLLGGDESVASQLLELQHAVQTSGPVQPCQEWTFTLTGSSPAVGGTTVFQYDASRLRIDQSRGTVELPPHTANSWPASISGEDGTCDDNGTVYGIQLLPDAFHYDVSATASSSEIDVTIHSGDVNVQITGTSDLACQAFGALGEQMLDAFFSGPMTLPFTVTGDSRLTLHSDDGNGNVIDAVLQRAS